MPRLFILLIVVFMFYLNTYIHQAQFQDLSKGGGARFLGTQIFAGKEQEIASGAKEKNASEARKINWLPP